MATPPTQNHNISLQAAAVLTKKYRDNNPSGTRKGGFFWKDQVTEMLNNSKAIGMRYYYGIDSSDKPVLVLTAVDDQGNDLCDDKLLELAVPCPDICSVDNSLNSD